MAPPTFAETWDLIFFVMLLPVVILLGSQLPDDWANHNGASLPGTATVAALEPNRGGAAVLVDVRDETGQIVAVRQEINGYAPHRLGASFAVQYLPSDSERVTRVYVAGDDLFRFDLAVFVTCALMWLITLPFVAARMVRLARWVSARRRPRRTGPYRAGHGYTRE